MLPLIPAYPATFFERVFLVFFMGGNDLRSEANTAKMNFRV
jgi:hypothetical protein